MRALAMTFLATVSLATACGGDDGPGEWPEPPTDAASSCRYEIAPARPVASGAIYYDAGNRVFRADGFWYDDDDDLHLAAWTFGYDDQGRVTNADYLDHGITYVYGDQSVTSTDDNGYAYSFSLVDDRLSRWEGPLSLPAAERNVSTYEYDSTGNPTRRAGASRYDLDDGNGVQIDRYDHAYTYDANGRIATRTDHDQTSTITYTETADHLDVDLVTTELELETFPNRRWSISYDDEHRLTRIEYDDDRDGVVEVASTFTYTDGQIVEMATKYGTEQTITATGDCPLPAIKFSLATGYPITWGASMIQQNYTGYGSYLFDYFDYTF